MEEQEQYYNNLITDYSWLVRPCSLYKEEYKDCKSIKSRFHQHFVYGSFVDCSQWGRDYDNCVKWDKDKNNNSFRELVKSEMSRRVERIKAREENDIWEKRTSPPSSWNDPLPKNHQERAQKSFLFDKDNENLKESSTCQIM